MKVGATAGKTDLPAAQKKIQTNMRTLRGHAGAITALHCVTRKEVWDLVGDREDAGFFISGSTDCTVRLSFMRFVPYFHSFVAQNRCSLCYQSLHHIERV